MTPLKAAFEMLMLFVGVVLPFYILAVFFG